MQTLIFATGNTGKIREVKAILDDQFDIKGLEDIGCREELPETSPTIAGNARQKALYVAEHYGVDCFAEDTGLEIDALGGEPGVYSARYAGPERRSEDNTRLVLERLEGRSDRSARFRTVIALVTGGQVHTFEGIAEGRIATEARGTGGFGYDPIFVPAGHERTFAEMEAGEKNAISHRKNAVRQLVAFLKGGEAQNP